VQSQVLLVPETSNSNTTALHIFPTILTNLNLYYLVTEPHRTFQNKFFSRSKRYR